MIEKTFQTFVIVSICTVVLLKYGEKLMQQDQVQFPVRLMEKVEEFLKKNTPDCVNYPVANDYSSHELDFSLLQESFEEFEASIKLICLIQRNPYFALHLIFYRVDKQNQNTTGNGDIPGLHRYKYLGIILD